MSAQTPERDVVRDALKYGLLDVIPNLLDSDLVEIVLDSQILALARPIPSAKTEEA